MDEEVLIRALVSGGVLAAVIVAANLTWKLVRSHSEGARRTKFVLSVVALFLIGSMAISAMGVVNTLITAVVIAALVWIVKGFRRPN